MDRYEDIQQVCKNGHQITNHYQTDTRGRKQFCPQCGEATITACPSCGGEIQGAIIKVQQDWLGARTGSSTKIPVTRPVVPSYCAKCGKPYPWTESRIATAIQILTEFGDLSEEEERTLEQDINNIAKDAPQAELSANRIKRIWGKCNKAAYEIIMELASRTAAKILKDS